METQSQTKDGVLKCLSSRNTDVNAKTEHTFKKLENLFTALNTESKCDASFEHKQKTVEPVKKTNTRTYDHCHTAQTNPHLPRVCCEVFVKLQFFNTSDNFAVDIMHNILQAVAQL